MKTFFGKWRTFLAIVIFLFPTLVPVEKVTQEQLKVADDNLHIL